MSIKIDVSISFTGPLQVVKKIFSIWRIVLIIKQKTVVLRRWEIETEIYFIKRVDKGQIATVKDFES